MAYFYALEGNEEEAVRLLKQADPIKNIWGYTPDVAVYYLVLSLIKARLPRCPAGGPLNQYLPEPLLKAVPIAETML